MAQPARARALAALACAACMVAASSAAPVAVTPPPSSSHGSPAAALVFLPAAGYDASAYANATAAAQAAAAPGLAVWTAVVAGGASAPAPVSAVPAARAALGAAGFPAGSPVFAGTHGPSGAAALASFVSDGVAGARESSAALAGLVFLGGFIPRAQRGDGASGALSVPALTVAAELDGVARLTRVGAEALFTQVLAAANPAKAAVSWPVVVAAGAAHASFADSTPPPAVAARDLVPEASKWATHEYVGGHVATFMTAHAAGAADADRERARSALAATADPSHPILGPLISAMQMDANHRLAPVCNSDFPTNPTCQYTAWPNHTLFGPPKPPPNPLPPSNCQCGSSWVMQYAQAMMAGFSMSSKPGVTTWVRDAFHDVSDTQPFHLPHVFNNVTGATGVLNSTTVSQPVFVDTADDGLAPLGAIEFKTKLKSRQAMWQSAGIKASDSNATDGSLKMCRSINEAALTWALKHAPSGSLKRYQSIGEALTPVDDVKSGFGITGPQWIKDTMVYTRVKNSNPTGKATTMVEVQSWTMVVANLFNGHDPWWIPVGMHYCKLLPVGSAMEWLMVDSLRQFGSLANQTAAN